MTMDIPHLDRDVDELDQDEETDEEEEAYLPTVQETYPEDFNGGIL